MVTIKDVALDANVAVGTVSKVINGQHVSEKNKKKVEASIKKLGYQINYYARGLKTQKTYTIATIVPEILNPFFHLGYIILSRHFIEMAIKCFCVIHREIVQKKITILK